MLYTRMFAVDGNFTAVHERQKRADDDVHLSDGLSFTTLRHPYMEHLKIALETYEVRSSHLSRLALIDGHCRKEIVMNSMPKMTTHTNQAWMPVASALWHAFGMGSSLRKQPLIFRKAKGRPSPENQFCSVTNFGRQMNIDYAVCKALNSADMQEIRRALLAYDIACGWAKKFLERVAHSEYLSLPDGLELLNGIGDFHIRGHVPACFPRYALMFIEGAGVIDGEVVETLWSVLNETSRSSRGATLAHRNEILDDHMNHSNWKKVIRIGKCHQL